MKKKLFWALPETVWLHHKPPDKDYRIVKYNQHGKIFIMYIKKPGPNLQTKAGVISQLHRTSWVENQRKTVRKAENVFPVNRSFIRWRTNWVRWPTILGEIVSNLCNLRGFLWSLSLAEFCPGKIKVLSNYSFFQYFTIDVCHD